MIYKPTIGLEIHAEIKTKTKMFCSCKNDPNEERPNVNICPVCLAHPGTLPVINMEAVKHLIKIGKAVNGEVPSLTEFDRKNYFYPDIPKGYQLSQYKFPLVKGGELAGVKITRIHLEEDTGTSLHVSLGEKKYSLINFNRAGVPLMELVTEPVLHSSKEVVEFSKELQLLLRYLNIADANMEKGEMRIEANVSVSDNSDLGTKVEIKNLNSFKIAEKAINYEIDRQIELLKEDEKIIQETRGWDENANSTFSQRQKEDSHDYRYFPDPDLPKLNIKKIEEFSEEEISKNFPETPSQKRIRLKSDYLIKDSDIDFYISNTEFSDFFENSVRDLSLYQTNHNNENIQLLSNYITSDIASMNDSFKNISTKNFAELISLIIENKISSRGAKDILPLLSGSKATPLEIAKSKNIIQVSSEDSLKPIVQKLIKENNSVVLEYKNGKESALQFLVGQGMKISKGSANPQTLAKIIKENI